MGIHNPDRLDRLDDATRTEIISVLETFHSGISQEIIEMKNALLAEMRKGDLALRQEHQELLDAISAGGSSSGPGTFSQPPLLRTSPPPFSVIFGPGETKEIVPESTVSRRIIIKSLNGEIKLLLGTSQNIELSAIAVDSNNLVDERWQGQIFGYSEKGGVIAVNVEKAATINAPPIAKNDQTTAMHNQAVVVNILSNDSDPDGSITGIDLDIYTPDMQNTASTSQGIFSVDNSGELVFTPADGFAGMASLNYQVFDDAGATDTANINITVDEPPPFVLTNDNRADRIIITGPGIYSGSNVGASSEQNEDLLKSDALGMTVWYEFVSNINEYHRIIIRPKNPALPDPGFYFNLWNDQQGWTTTAGVTTVFTKISPTLPRIIMIDSLYFAGEFELDIKIEPL